MQKLEVRRQLFHIFVGLVFIIGFYYNVITPLIVFILLILGIITSFTLKKVRIRGIVHFLELFQREEEKQNLPGRGAIFFFTGVLLAMQLFTKDVALAAITILTLGDSISHIIGRSFGKTRNFINGANKKLLEGTGVGILVAFVGAALFVSPLEALLASVVAMGAELAEVKLAEKVIDDNLLIPLVAGTVIMLMRLFL